jgi:hypothetical protein
VAADAVATSIASTRPADASAVNAGVNDMPDSLRVPKLFLQKSMGVLIFLGLAAYIVVAVAFAIYFLINAYLHPVGDFEKAAIGAVIAVIGTGLTAVSAVYTANRQALAAQRVQILSAKLTTQIEGLKAESAQSLERLKAFLDADKNAYRELSGSAATYFYSLRSVAMDQWNDAILKAAEDGMVAATRYLIYVEQEMRDTWLRFWQEAQLIHRTARNEPDDKKRPDLIRDEIMKDVPTRGGTLNFRDQYQLLEDTARRAITRERSG